MRYSDQFELIATALAEAQGEFAVADRNAVNPHFKNNYANLASVRNASYGPLSKHGIALLQGPQRTTALEASTEWELVTRLIHKSGQWAEIEYPIHSTKADAQGFAAGMTYARRISWQTITGVVSDDDTDDDGETNKKDTVVDQAEAASRANIWVKKAIAAINKMESREALEAWQGKFKPTIENVSDANPNAYIELRQVMNERARALAPVQIDTPRSEPPPPAQPAEPDEFPDWLNKRLDELSACTSPEEAAEVHQSVVDRADVPDELFQVWTVRYNAKLKNFRASAVSAKSRKPAGG